MGEEEIKRLQEMGTGKLYGPGSSLTEAVEYIKSWYQQRQSE